MNRAAILIGVRKTGNLQPLQAVLSGVHAMEMWARQQGFGDENIVCVTDEHEAVTAKRVKDAVRAVVNRGTCQQLIVYFAGHGVNIRYGEYWLLSGAPEDTQEAVNVEGSQILARQCGIPHVVFISDACRTAAEGIQAQYVTGSEIFPNESGANGPEISVDLFFACTLGRPALEIRDPDKMGAAYQALYTNALVAALEGKQSGLRLETADDGIRYVRPRPLKRFLSSELNDILAKLALAVGINQTPDARITSDESAWLSRLAAGAAAVPLPTATGCAAPRPAATPDAVPLPPSTRAPPPPPSPAAQGPVSEPSATRGLETRDGEPSRGAPEGLSAQVLSKELIGAALEQTLPTTPTGQFPPPPPSAAAGQTRGASEGAGLVLTEGFTPSRGGAGFGGTPTLKDGADSLLLSAKANAQQFGPTHFDTHCGFKIRGERIASVRALGGTAQTMDSDRTLVRVTPTSLATSLILRFDSGAGTVLPAIPQFLTEVTFEDQELVSVTYEPSEDTGRWHALREHIPQLRWLRSVVAASASLGVFRLEGQEALHLARVMQFNKSVDPSMAVYAAYAYHALGRTDLIREMRAFQQADVGVTFFDLAMLSRETVDNPMSLSPFQPLPMFPLLSQGWGLLNALGVSLPDNLSELSRHLKPSLWTLLDANGMDLVDRFSPGN